MGEKT